MKFSNLSKYFFVLILYLFSFYDLFAGSNDIFPKAEIRMDKYSGSPKSIRFQKGSQPTFLNFLENYRSYFNFSAENELKLHKVIKDNLGQTHYRFKQYYKGIEVEGVQYILHEKNGVIFYVNGCLIHRININTQPTISKEQAKNNVLNSMIGEKKSIDENSGILKIVPIGEPLSAYNYKLARYYKISQINPYSKQSVYIDANNGSVIKSENLRKNADVSGTGIPRYPDNANPVSITVDNYAGSYRLRESGRGQGILTFNRSSSVDFTSPSTFFNYATEENRAGVSVHFGIEQSFDYFMNEYSFHTDFEFMSIVNSTENPYNAYYEGDGDFSFGTGGYNEECNIYSQEWVSMDVVAHEFTHGVTDLTADLHYYSEESGPLNESFSDIFGTVIEFYTGNYGQGGNWQKAEDVITNYPNMIGNFENPNYTDFPDTYQGTHWYNNEPCKDIQHTNSWAQNYWFYLLSEGGSGYNDNDGYYNVTGIDMDDAAAIAFRNLSVYMWEYATFQDARWHSIDATVDIYGLGSDEWQSVKDAWYAVGVYEPALPTPVITDVSTSNGQITIEFNSGNSGAYKIFYDSDMSGPPYDGNDAEEGSSPIFDYGLNGQFTLSGLTNGQRYYIAIKGINEAGESVNYSNEINEVSPITTSGTLTQDEIWPGDGNPDGIVEVTGDVYVPNYIMLNIEPGTTIKLKEGVKIETDFYLRAIGTASEPITFTSYYDNPTTGQYWDRIKYDDASSWEVLKYCNFEYANVGTELDHSSIRIENCNYSNIQSTAIKVIAASPKITDCDISANTYGIYFYNTNNISNQPEIRSNMVHNSYYGLYMYNSSPNIFDFNEIYETTIANFCYLNSSPYYGGDDYFGNNNIHNNNYGVLAAYSSNPFLGWKGRFDSGNNSITESSLYHVRAISNCMVMAWKNWWGQYPPDANKFNAIINSVIWNGSALTGPPQNKNSIMLSNDTEPNFAKGSNLRQKVSYARHLINGDSVTFAQDICKDIIRNHPDSSAAYFALDVLWEASRNFKAPVTHNLNSFKNYLKELSIKSHNKHLYAYAKLVLSGFEEKKGLARINNIARTHRGTIIGELALFKKFMFYFVEKENIIPAEKTLRELESIYPGSISTLEAQNLFNNLSNSGKSLSFKNTNNEYLKVVPDKFELHGNFPNPFNPTTTISFALPKRSEVEIIIYDALGKKIKTILSSTLGEGIGNTEWDGTNQFGDHVSSGIYFYTFKAKALDGNGELFTKSAKLLLMK